MKHRPLHHIPKRHFQQFFAVSLAVIFLLTGMLCLGSTTAKAETSEATPTPSEGATTSALPDFSQEPAWADPAWGSTVYDVPLALTSHDHFYFTHPLAIANNHHLNADYRYGYYYPEEDVVHTGIDIIGSRGDPVLAAAAGKVIFAGYGLLNGANSTNDPYGMAVMIRHDFTFQGYTIYSVYAHLDKVTVNKGDWVETGTQVGVIGMTGNTSGPHLHFEIRIENQDGDKVQNPELWIAPLVGYGILAGRVETSYGMLLTTKNLWLKSLDSGKTQTLITYAPKTKQVDDYYQENFAVGDLPAGDYELSTYYNGVLYKQNIYIAPGAVNYIVFRGTSGFSQDAPEDLTSASFLIPYP